MPPLSPMDFVIITDTATQYIPVICKIPTLSVPNQTIQASMPKEIFTITELNAEAIPHILVEDLVIRLTNQILYNSKYNVKELQEIIFKLAESFSTLEDKKLSLGQTLCSSMGKFINGSTLVGMTNEHCVWIKWPNPHHIFMSWEDASDVLAAGNNEEAHPT
ncbi:hypothetical protein P154DRAFT_577205 [Amniculicola lignicola CBS 123094]|uniref:Uncharacterized protein n=1 Tax=Amniculicola lignicola CBS 123094 TaxID=1392246 RepID=A0A6A5WNV0_9PLEO|nr:hypothetical protein P154DRAFT_577205 [Amniculicola lignicola CBS 123094]